VGQFSYFVNLVKRVEVERAIQCVLQVVWLLGLFGKKIPSPKDFDDPAVVCTSLMNELKLTGFPPPSFSLTKLHKGYGDEVELNRPFPCCSCASFKVCGILNGLLDAVLSKAEFKFQSPVYPQYEFLTECSFLSHCLFSIEKSSMMKRVTMAMRNYLLTKLFCFVLCLLNVTLSFILGKFRFTGFIR